MSTCTSFAGRLARRCGPFIFLGMTACSGGTAEPNLTKLDDMEGTSGLIEWTSPAGARPGGWDSAIWAAMPDDTQSDHLLPIAANAGGAWSYEAVPSPYQTLPGILSKSAARLRTTSPLVNDWGAGMGFDFAAPPARPVDLSPYQGITFWGRAEAGADPTRISIQIQDSNTDARGNVCDKTMPDSDQRSCSNAFEVSVDLTDMFTRYTVHFSQLKQSAFGYRIVPSVLQIDKIYSLAFGVWTPGGACQAPAVCAGGVSPTLTFDIWIDDLYLVSK
jgi:hypothetical protein